MPAEGTAAGATAYTYTATDSDSDEATLTFMITIQEDRMPTFSGAIAAQIYTVGAAITALTLPAATGGDGELTYSLTPPDGMTFKEDTRELSGAPTTEAVATDYTLTARDGDGDTEDFVFSVTVRAGDATPITLISKTLNVPSVSTSDATTMLTSTVAWAATESVGWITDVAPAVGTGTNTAKAITLTYTANMGAARTGTVTFTETTAGANPKFSVELRVTQAADLEPDFGNESVAAQIYTVDAEIAALTLPEATGGDGDLTYSLTPPAGMAFDPDTRELSGAPTAVQAATEYTYTVEDGDGDTDELVFSVTVRAGDAAPITLTSETLNVTSVSTSDATTMLTSTVAWAATESEDWITDVDPAEETGTSTSQAITLTYTANMGAARTGTVTFTETTAGVNPKFSVELRVTQAADLEPDFGGKSVSAQIYTVGFCDYGI